MKTLTTMTAVAALIAGMSIAGAQTNDGKTTNPSSINAAPTQQGNTGKSGMQPEATKNMPGASRSMQGKSDQQAETVNPASPNAAPTGAPSAMTVSHSNDDAILTPCLTRKVGNQLMNP